MQDANIEQLREAIEGTVIVRPSNFASLMSRLKLDVPTLERGTNEDGQDVLLWSSRRRHLSDPLDTCFADFMTLVDAPTENIIHFARRFGPLHRPVLDKSVTSQGGHGEVSSRLLEVDSSEEAEGSSSDSFSEPLWAWRMYARGLRALINVMEAARQGYGAGSEDLISAFAAVAVPQWLDSSASSRSALVELKALSLATEHLLAGEIDERIVTAALESAGVGPAFLSMRQGNADPVYSLRLRKLSPTNGTQGQAEWGLPGLLPVLAISLAFALKPEEPTICTWCKKPAAVVRRRPRKGHPWFGDHGQCRALARVETQIRSEEKRAARRRARSEEG